MKKSLRTIFRIVMMAIIVVSMAACGGDEVAPTISKDGTLTHTIGDADYDFNGVFSATDDVDGDVTASIVVDDSAVDYTTAGTYSVSVTAKDEAGNEASRTYDFTVNNETVAPVISGMVNVSIEQGEDTFDYMNGVTANDNLDGDITANVVVDDSAVDYTKIGIYRVYYRVTDAAGNEAEEKINVNVTYETVAPVLEGLTDITVGVDNELPDFLAGVTANDNLDGDITADIEVSYGAIDMSTLGTYEITYTVEDAAKNETTQTIMLHVVDLTAPVIEGHRDLTFKVFTNPDFLWQAITVNDNIDGDILENIVIDSSQVNMNVLGDYDLTYSATDSAGNTTTVTVTITVKDFNAPEYTSIDTIYYLDGDADPIYLDYVEAVDNYDGDVTSTITFDDSAVDLTTVGVYDIIMTVTDSSGNTQTGTLQLVVPSQAEVDNVNNDIATMGIPTEPVTGNLYLRSVGDNGTSIAWDSLNDQRLTDGGKILPPGINEPNATVTLIGTFAYGTYVKTVEYTIIIAAKQEAVIDNSVTYDYFGVGTEWTTQDSTLEAYFEAGSVIPYVDVEDLFAVTSGAVDYGSMTFSYTAPVLTVTYTYNYIDDDGVDQTEEYVAYFDFDENTVTSPNMDFFYSYYFSTAGSSDAFEGLNFESVETVAGHEVVFDLGYYGFDMVAYDDSGTMKYLVPFNTLQTLLFGPQYFGVYYNGDAFYGTETYQQFDTGSQVVSDYMVSSLNDASAPTELKLAAYNHLVFALDHYFGLKDISGVETYYNELEQFIVPMVFSNDQDFYRAIFDIIYFLDDPHTYNRHVGYYQPESFNFDNVYPNYGPRTMAHSSAGNSFRNYYEGVYGETIPRVHITEDGKTAIIHIPTMNDLSTPDWVKEEIANLPASVENIVMDVALNGGGWTSVSYQLMAIMTNNPFYDHELNTLDGSVSSYKVTSDYDAHDEYNWFVLTTNASYSASSLLTSMAKSAGIPIIGVPVGGGASSVQMLTTYGGSLFVFSSARPGAYQEFNEETGEMEYISYEFGIPVDYYLTDFLNEEELALAISTILTERENEESEE